MKKEIMNKVCVSMLFAGLVALVVSCDPARNTAINRFYHSTTAQYNGYFNANLLLDESLNNYRDKLKENYYERLPIDAFPSEEEVISMYPAIDTAIAKCTKVIEDHSMPGGRKMSTKKEENNSFIDENWITIGRASYIRRDYDAAMKNFKFIKKFYDNDPSNYVGELWMAKTNIQLNELTKAQFNLDALQKAIDRENNDETKFIEKIKTRIQEGKDEDAPAKFPKGLRYEYYKTVAELALIKEDRDKAKENLRLAAKYAKKRPQKARIFYILGQLYEEDNDRSMAEFYYTKVLKNNAPYPMQFSAKLKRSFLGADERLIKDLKKMLRDEKNAEYKDQIYYALAQIDKQNKNEDGYVENLTLSAFYSTSNARQKAIAYEELGDLRFDKKDYVPAQKYYDSCANVMPESYPNAEAIRKKAEKLSDLVAAVETIEFQDSVQRIARMAEYEREDFLKDVIKTMKKREEERKRKEAEKLAALQQSNNFNQTQGGNKWYFRNAKTRQEGYEEFTRLWGDRKNEDDWRRSTKTPKVPTGDAEADSLGNEDLSVDELPADSLTVDILIKDIPLTDAAMDSSNALLAEALYNAGLIYKDQLKELRMAEKNFVRGVNMSYESEFRLRSAFELYKMNTERNPSMAEVNKQFIIGNYPESDYAAYLKDPDYFVKKKELEAETEKAYVKTLERFEKGYYYPALRECEEALAAEETSLTPKYMLLKALCQGKLNNDKNTLLPTLKTLAKNYPSTPEAARAEELMGIIKNGVSKNEPTDFGNKSLYEFDGDASHFVVIFLPEGQNSALAKSKISDFSREFFSRVNLKIKSSIFTSTQSVVLVESFDNADEALEYLKVYKATRKHLLDLQNAPIYPITQSNLKVLFEDKGVDKYDLFFTEYY